MKAIETSYKGYRFRSRLEARWAVFFDALGLRWAYEPEGFDLGSAGWYLPDFWIADLDCYFEVKGPNPTENEKIKALRLSSGTKKVVVIAKGYITIEAAEFALVTWLERLSGSRSPGEFKMRAFAGEAWEMWSHGISGWDFLEHQFKPDHLPEFLRKQFADECVPDGNTEEGRQRLVELDKRYYRQKYGQEHPAYVLGRHMDNIYWTVNEDGKVGLTNLSRNRDPERFAQAYAKATSARFEYGESG